MLRRAILGDLFTKYILESWAVGYSLVTRWLLVGLVGSSSSFVAITRALYCRERWHYEASRLLTV